MPRAWNRQTLIALHATHTARKVAEPICYPPLHVAPPPEPRRLPFIKMTIPRITFVRASVPDFFRAREVLVFFLLLILFLVLPALLVAF